MDPRPKGPQNTAAKKRKATESDAVELNPTIKKMHNDSERKRKQEMSSNITALGELVPIEILELARAAIENHRRIGSGDSDNNFPYEILRIMSNSPPDAISYKKNKKWTQIERIVAAIFYCRSDSTT